jgi:bifunctional oligoribonuclease and PAP phosphatase NrnA
MIEDNTFQKAVDLINKSRMILITTHAKPDGDALGSLTAVCEALKKLGKEVKPLLLSRPPQVYDFLFEEKAPVLGRDVQLDDLTAGRFGNFDLIVIVDTNSPTQLPEFEKYLKTASAPVLVIDHHRTSDGLGGVELADADTAAAGLVVLDLFKYAGWEITKKIAEALFVAVSTDTGWFEFNNTDGRVFSACAELIAAGAEPAKIYHQVYENFSIERFNLMILMLNSFRLHLDGRYAVMKITQQDFKQTGAILADTDNLINECRRINTVDTIALFTELKDGRIRCSLRSKGAVDVSEVAAKFGGGGHKMAAGAFVPAPIENAMQLIYNEIVNKLGCIE